MRKSHDKTLSVKIKHINATVPIGVVAELVGVDEEVTSQIHCPFHGRDTNKSARIFIHDVGDKANGIYCYVCGNYKVWDIAFQSFGKSYSETLNYFEKVLGVKYKGVLEREEREDENYNVEVAKIVKKLRRKSLKKRELVKIAEHLAHQKINKLKKLA